MGSTCSAVREEITEVVDEGVKQVHELQAEVKEKGAAAVVQEKAEAAAETVAEAFETAKEKAAEVAGEVQEKVGEAVEQVTEAITGAPQPEAGTKEATEAVAGTMDAAMAAAAAAITVVFDDGRGAARTVEFKTRALGFEVVQASSGCCGKTPKGRVVVRRVDPKQQAAALGVQQKWALKSVNGTEVTGVEQARKLLAEAAEKLVEA